MKIKMRIKIKRIKKLQPHYSKKLYKKMKFTLMQPICLKIITFNQAVIGYLQIKIPLKQMTINLQTKFSSLKIKLPMYYKKLIVLKNNSLHLSKYSLKKLRKYKTNK